MKVGTYTTHSKRCFKLWRLFKTSNNFQKSWDQHSERQIKHSWEACQLKHVIWVKTASCQIIHRCKTNKGNIAQEIKFREQIMRPFKQISQTARTKVILQQSRNLWTHWRVWKRDWLIKRWANLHGIETLIGNQAFVEV